VVHTAILSRVVKRFKSQRVATEGHWE